jgi:hypothetical protein
VPKFMPTSGCLLSGQLKNFPHLPLFHHDPPNVGGPLEKKRHCTRHISRAVCLGRCASWHPGPVTKWSQYHSRVLPISHDRDCPKWIESRNLCFKRSDSAVLKKQQRILQKCTECTDQMRRARCRSKGGQVHNVLAGERQRMLGSFSVQRLHGFRQVVQHVQLHVAK